MPHSDESPDPITTFADLGLSAPVLQAVQAIGYEEPTAIQARVIPLLLEGRDLVGQAQTGTGKTAAFALPLLSRIEFKRSGPQILVLVPTRELAIQVAEAFQRYASHLPDFHVLPVYGGAGYGGQLSQLKRGVQVIVATPGRLTDHLRRGTLSLKNLECVVLDEADEMLRMGFIEEVEWILEQTPAGRQIALFSATMPEEVRRIARGHLQNPAEVTIASRTASASTVKQRYWLVSGLHKLDALTRILEGEPFDAMIVFVRTKMAAEELARKLQARGFACEPLNGDLSQAQREATVERLRRGQTDIVVATDVAARGLDVKRISHVINYDIPGDTESYIHRIGRTGRAGREGHAILFVAPRERRLLVSIERATNQRIELMSLPSSETINDIRIARFKEQLHETLAQEDLGLYYQAIEEYQKEHNVPAMEIAAALARMLAGDNPLLPNEPEPPPPPPPAEHRERSAGARIARNLGWTPSDDDPVKAYKLNVGRAHHVKPGAIVGAIANEAGIEGRHIGNIRIGERSSTVELPFVPSHVLEVLKKARVAGRELGISILGDPIRREVREGVRERAPRRPPEPARPPRMKFKRRRD